MNTRPIPAREIGLLTLLAAGLAVLGIAMSMHVEGPPTLSPVEDIILSEISIVVPQFVAGPGPVNLNTATIEELEKLPGIGEALAARIIADRAENGPYASIDDVTRVSGIGPATVDGFRERATVSEP